jgi:hypothetical protein
MAHDRADTMLAGIDIAQRDFMLQHTSRHARRATQLIRPVERIVPCCTILALNAKQVLLDEFFRDVYGVPCFLATSSLCRPSALVAV